MAEMDKSPKKISLKALYKDLITNFNNVDVNYLYLTAVLGLLIILYVFWSYKGVGKRKITAIVGLCGSGKTLLFSHLCHGTEVLTVTSIKESSGTVTLSNGNKALIYDLPGYDRIRYSIFDKMKDQIRALAFIIDSSTIQDDLKDVAEFLYTIFCDPVVQKFRPALLIVCNKQDIPTAKGCALIKTSLEREINLLRVTKSSQLKSVGENAVNNNSFIGYKNRDFEFSHLKHMKVSFTEAVATEGKQIDDIKKWLQDVV